MSSINSYIGQSIWLSVGSSVRSSVIGNPLNYYEGNLLGHPLDHPRVTRWAVHGYLYVKKRFKYPLGHPLGHSLDIILW